MTTGQDQILLAVRTALGPYRGAGVCVALSGGLDSVVLLHALVQLRRETPFQLSALHVHHGLSPNADRWAGFCRDLCSAFEVPCEVTRLALPAAAGRGLERVAREARYQAFAAAPGDVLCLAHHQNDRAETLLLNLFRGAGATGLGGVPDVRKLGSKDLMRPFIDVPRSTLEAWAVAHQLRWVEDESNQNLVFRRNHIRHRVLPTIAETYPGVVGVLARTSAQMMEQAGLLDRLAESDARGCRDQDGLLSVTLLQQLPETAVRNVLRHRLAKAGVRIPAARRLQAFSAQLMTATSDTEAFVRMGTVGIHLWRDQIWVDHAIDQSCPLSYEAKPGMVAWPDGQLKIEGALTRSAFHVMALGHGQRFQPAGRCHDRVNELLRAQGVPPWVRPRLPTLRDGDLLVWVPHLEFSESVKETKTGLTPTWVPTPRHLL